MKVKIFTKAVLAISIIMLGTACDKNFLEVKPKGLFLESNYYQTADEAKAGLMAIYLETAMEFWAASTPTSGYASKLGALNCAADECYTGGGNSSDIPGWQVWNTYTLTEAQGPQYHFWGIDYQGIYTANLLLSKMTSPIPGLSTDLQNRYIAEAKFLRAYFYFELVRLFKNVPLILTPLGPSDWGNVTQAQPQEVYAQIEKDLNDAIPVLPPTVASTETGRATKGAAMALLGKAILFQNDNARMAEAANWFSQVRTSGLYSLLLNFGDIFRTDNKFNSESVFEIVHSTAQNSQWGQTPYPGNLYAQMCGPRTYSGPTFWSGGWSFSPIIPSFVSVMQGDPRYKYTISNIDSLCTATGTGYVPGYQNTGYFVRKFAPLANDVNHNSQVELNFPNDYIEIRYADVLLMEAEAIVRSGALSGQEQTNLDRVRARVGLTSVPATLDNIYKERMLELATEGHRWYDLVRTGQAATTLAFKGFVAGKHELLPIPLRDLNGTKLKQNPNY